MASPLIVSGLPFRPQLGHQLLYCLPSRGGRARPPPGAAPPRSSMSRLVAVRATRAARFALVYAAPFAPLLSVTRNELDAGRGFFEKADRLGAFDAVLPAAVAMRRSIGPSRRPPRRVVSPLVTDVPAATWASDAWAAVGRRAPRALRLRSRGGPRRLLPMPVDRSGQPAAQRHRRRRRWRPFYDVQRPVLGTKAPGRRRRTRTV